VELEFTKREVVFTTYLVKLIILAAFPASILIYRSKLLSFQAFLIIKKHQGRREGVAYNRCLHYLDLLFCLSRLRRKNYIEYVNFRSIHRSEFAVQAHKAFFVILILWVGVIYYFSDVNFAEFFLPVEYVGILIMLLFQRAFMFVLKVTIFWPCYGFYAFAVFTFKNRCKCKKKRREPINNDEDL